MWTTDAIPPIDSTIDQLYKRNRSRHPLRVLGYGSDGTRLTVTEEQRESHLHIIGTTGEGKSKFLQKLIQDDIDRGNGLIFFDPSDRGDTMYKVLAYCAKRKHKKVLVIDPHHHHLYKKVAPINPFGKYKEASVSNVMDTFRVLFNVKDAAETARIQRYMTAILSLLWTAKATLKDSLYFTEPGYIVQRMRILEKSDEFDRHRMAIEEVFKSRAMYLNELQSTVRRLEPLFHPTLSTMLGQSEGIDFARMIADKWVILVNLYSGFGFEPIHTRLLGTTIINEIISALDRLKTKNWKGVYYLYLDEAGRYANRNLADLLTYKRKSGLRVTIAHQYFKQFEDPYILEAVKELCKIKVAFYQPDPTERMETVKQMFGGELKDRDVSYSLSNLKKQYCVIKKPKQAPMVVRVPDVPDTDFNFKPYLEKLYQNPIYKSADEINHDPRPTHTNTTSPKRGKKVDSRPARQDSVPPGDKAVDDLFSRFSGSQTSVPPRVSTDPPNPKRPRKQPKQTRKKEAPG